jgi:hypothetical protein
VKTLEQYALELREMYGWDEFKALAEARDAEHRRLVEEAQAETRRVSNEAQFRLLAFGAAAEEAQAERDRLKGELAEARRLLAVEIPTEHEMRCKTMHGTRDCWRCDVDAFLAATPAEQAQPTGARPGELGSHLFTPTQIAIANADGRMRVAANGLGWIRDMEPAKRSAAEQAQGEAACASCGRPGPGCMESAQVAALAKRVDELEHEAQEDAKAWADTALTLMNRVTKLEAPAPPPPEAAGPGHAFVPTFNPPGHPLCGVPGCMLAERFHAVPPIPEGGAR